MSITFKPACSAALLAGFSVFWFAGEPCKAEVAESKRTPLAEVPAPVATDSATLDAQPKHTRDGLSNHLYDYQMEVIRDGHKPLPIPLAPEQISQLIKEGVLPPSTMEQMGIFDPTALTGDEVAKQVSAYQMERLRKGLSPLPTALTPDDQDIQSAKEDVPPPVGATEEVVSLHQFRTAERAVEKVKALGAEESKDLLIQMLNDDRDTSFHATKALEEMGVERAYETLTNLFWQCGERCWRDNAHHVARAVGATRAPGAYDFLMQVLDLEPCAVYLGHPYVRAGAAVGLGRLGDKRAVPYLMQMVRTNDPAGYGAVEALAMLDARESADLLLERFQDPHTDKSIRSELVPALTRFEDRRAIPLFIDALEGVLNKAFGPEDQAEMDELQGIGLDEWNFIFMGRCDALVDALIQFNDSRAVDVMGKLLMRPEVERQKEIIEFLGSQDADGAVRWLVKAYLQVWDNTNDYTSADGQLLDAIIDSPAPIATSFWCAAVTPVQSSELSRTVPTGKGMAVGGLSGSETAEELFGILQNTEAPLRIRGDCVDALLTLDDQRNIPVFGAVLLNELDRPLAEVVGQAAKDEEEFWRRRGVDYNADVEIVRSTVSSDLCDPLVDALVNSKDPRAVSVLGTTLLKGLQAVDKDDVYDLSYYVDEIVSFLSTVPDDRALRYLVKGLIHERSITNSLLTEDLSTAVINSPAPSAREFWIR